MMQRGETQRTHILSASLLTFFMCACVLAYRSVAERLACIALSAAAAPIFFFLCRKKRYKYRLILFLCIAVTAAGVFSCLFHNVYLASYDSWTGTERTEKGVVVEIVSANTYSGSYLVEMRDGMRRYTVLLYTDAENWQIGEQIAGRILYTEWDNENFSTETYYGGKGAVACAENVDCAATGEQTYTLKVWFRRINQALSGTLSAHIHDGGLAAAVFLGDRTELSSSIALWFRRIGVYHLLAVSGTHLGILVGIAERFLVYVRIKPRKRTLCIIGLCLFYMALTGFSASVRRAGWMFIFAQLLQWRGAEKDAVLSLSLAATGMLLVSPHSVWDIGLHLSVCAVVGCCCFQAMLARHRKLYIVLAGKRATDARGKRLRRMRFSITSSIVMTAIVTAVMLPLSFLYFGEISLVACLANLLYIPAITVLIVLTFLYLLLYPFRFAIPLLATGIERYTALLLLPAKAIAEMRGVCVSLAYPGLWLYLLPIMVWTLALPYIRRRRYFCLYVCLFLLFGAHIAVCRAVTGTENVLIYRNDALRDGFVVQSAGNVWLVDISDGSYTFTNRLAETARERYAVEFDGYCITHYHKRHISAFQRLCGNWIVRGLYLPEPQTEEERYVCESLQRQAEEYGIPVTMIDGSVMLGNIETTLAERTYLSRSTHPITAVLFSSGDATVVYGSSAWNEGNAAIADWFANGNVLIFGAHSPVYKKPFSVQTRTTADAVIWNGNAAAFGEPIAAKYTAYDKKECLIRLP